jgi:hypothetical protein
MTGAVRMTLLMGALATGCVTPEPAKPVAKTSTKPKLKEKNADKTGDDVRAVPVPSPTAQLTFVRKHISPNSTFGGSEHEFVASLPNNPASGSIAEAALALGLVKSVLHPLHGDQATFQEAEITEEGETASKPVSSSSLEALCKSRQVSLADALVENPLLASYGVAKQVMAATWRSSNSEDFVNEVTVAVRGQANLWAGFAIELGGATAVATEDQPAPDGGAMPPPVVDDVPPNPADLRGGDSVLAEAQALADRGNYQAAIKKAAGVPDGSPMHASAKDKIREFSNLAVQDLRRKAAQAFQSAMPITDVKARAGYLKQAKTYLEDAIKNYPEATQLPTVRDNLRVISRDLEKLEAESEG